MKLYLPTHHTIRAAPSIASLVASTPRLLEYSVTLNKHAVVYDRLQEHGVQIVCCTRNAVPRRATVELVAENLHASDFAVATAFVIGVNDWNKHCSLVQPVEGVDEADEGLLNVLDVASGNGNQVSLVMSNVSGAEVAPELDIDISEKPVFVNVLPNTVVFNDSPFCATITSFLSTSINSMFIDSLLVAIRPTISHKTKVNLFTGTVLENDALLSVNISKFKVKRLLKTEVQ